LLAIFDVEGVLYDAEYLPLLAEKVNKENKIWEITKKGIEGKIDWVEGLKERVHLLRGMDYDTCIQVANSLPIMIGAREACRTLKDAGWKLMAVSGGFTIITDRLKKELCLDFVYSNELVFKDGKLDDVIVNVDSDKAKSAIIKIREWDEKKENITTYTEERENLSKEKHLYELATTLLKDTGIKTRIIKQYLPIINKLINKYLSAMDFYITFELDENFNETIKSRHRDEFTYASFSEGEKMRIDLALLFTWRAVAKLKNSVNTNLLVLDEVFDSSLDASGTDEFLKILYDLTHGTSSNINVFVISHKGEVLYDKFEKTVKFQKQKNFSTLAA